MRIHYDSGIYLAELDLWLDATRPRARAVVSHAHADHVARHEAMILTPATARLVRQRYRSRATMAELPYGETHDYGAFALTFYPAGHMLGSAQTLVQSEHGRLLYSGDLRLEPGYTAEPASVPAADTLIVEATFGHPRYRFPPPAHVIDAIVRFCHETLRAGYTPVLLAYSLGKAQELLAALAHARLPLTLHDAAHTLAEVYADLGAALPAFDRFDGARSTESVVICPPQARHGPPMAALPRVRTALISGWAVDRRARYRSRVDVAFPLSDHAGYDELLAYVAGTGARRVYTVYGFAADLAADLRARGYDARPLAPPLQERLF